MAFIGRTKTKLDEACRHFKERIFERPIIGYQCLRVLVGKNGLTSSESVPFPTHSLGGEQCLLNTHNVNRPMKTGTNQALSG